MRRLRAYAPRQLGAAPAPRLVGSLLAGVPCGVAVLALAGYFVAAGYVFGRLIHSLFVVLGAVALYGLMALWVQIQRQRLAREQDRERTQSTPATAVRNHRRARLMGSSRKTMPCRGDCSWT
jgi:small-conductance mechanosensitive channel